jgi:hypothetical protein
MSNYDLCRPPVETEALFRSVDRMTETERCAFAYWVAMTQPDVYESWQRYRACVKQKEVTR